MRDGRKKENLYRKINNKSVQSNDLERNLKWICSSNRQLNYLLYKNIWNVLGEKVAVDKADVF